MIDPVFFRLPVVECARRLLGVQLLVHGVGGLITETEAYHPDEPASHSYRGLTPRNRSMFGPVGTAYVYRSYGVHWCLNFVCGTEPGSAVLIRSLHPTHGLGVMQQRRGKTHPRELCTGPGKLTQALGLDGRHDGLSLFAEPFELRDSAVSLVPLVGPRIGITKATDLPWRFGWRDSDYLSQPFPQADSPEAAGVITPPTTPGR